MKWTVEDAQNHLTQIIAATIEEPQFIYTQEELVAAIVDPKLFQEFLNWQQQTVQSPLSQAFNELKQLCTEENYTLEIPSRYNRTNLFSEEENEYSL